MTAADHEKLLRLYDIYEQPMYRIAFAVLGNSDAAEDAVSDAFLRLIRHIRHIGEPDSPKTKAYIVKVIRSTSIEQYRKRRRRSELPIDDSILQIPDSGSDVEREVLGKDTADILQKLSDDDRRLVELRCLNGLSWRETADMLSLSETAARKRFERIKKRLKEMKGGSCDE